MKALRQRVLLHPASALQPHSHHRPYTFFSFSNLLIAPATKVHLAKYINCICTGKPLIHESDAWVWPLLASIYEDARRQRSSTPNTTNSRLPTNYHSQIISIILFSPHTQSRLSRVAYDSAKEQCALAPHRTSSSVWHRYTEPPSLSSLSLRCVLFIAHNNVSAMD